MTRNINRGAIPSDLGWLADTLDDYEERLRTLEAPDAQQLAKVVEELQETVAAVEDLVANLEARMTDFIDNDVEAIVDAKVAAAIAALLAGNVSIGGELHVTGRVFFAAAPGRVFVVEPRAVAWIDTSTGELGRT